MRRVLRAIPAVLFVASIASLLLSRGAETVPLYAARTGNMCMQCHFDPNGGGPRNDYGFMYARNRHSVEAESDSTLPWVGLDLTNKIGERMPIYLSLNQRFMLYDNNTKSIKGLDRFGFFGMENALQLAFQPHSKLTLVYSRDAFSQGGVDRVSVREKDAFGMIGLPGDAYLKAGRFRNPFGLRMDDHTVATRGGFTPSDAAVFLPYDPRSPDMGIEVGAARAPWFGRASFTNGSEDVFAGGFAETKSVKLGYNSAVYEGGVSLYDNYHRNRFGAAAGAPKRGTRWGYYGLTHFGPMALIGEVVAGTDEVEPDPTSGRATGPKTNKLAYFAEADYHPIRSLNFRLRYDRMELDRGNAVLLARDAAAHRRYAIEGEYVPVPFAELRWTLRRIDHELASIDDETEGYLQFHFSY